MRFLKRNIIFVAVYTWMNMSVCMLFYTVELQITDTFLLYLSFSFDYVSSLLL